MKKNQQMYIQIKLRNLILILRILQVNQVFLYSLFLNKFLIIFYLQLVFVRKLKNNQKGIIIIIIIRNQLLLLKQKRELKLLKNKLQKDIVKYVNNSEIQLKWRIS
ncbi:hypothetical protein IMG5_148310 [Ichthyophthirius multifiliis]|uniref:Transmembrane protein n=1 Tax=Ichthyophthirius multifiliis TaxID=5932 RepID=G0QY99_ICHMU|nr:hypothetical protein IMG5_148310 [Ichthyophthirius multifiliis]EGR29803.1 hypothetical protein IMG5_148310 [Ichthyophthirius multifiliis]|eukprot:XP_004031039.1 hypothetical protein IMG5_148310 [Ichthyophthirius multifiliis]